LPGRPEVWVETDAEVRTIESGSGVGSRVPSGGATTSAAPVGKARPNPLLSRILQTDLLDVAIERLRHEAQSGTMPPDRRKRLGDLLRQRGDLAAAARTYEELLVETPGDPTVARLVAILKGQGLPQAQVTWPEPFVLVQDFLPEARLDEMRAFARAHQDRFAETPVLLDGRNVVSRADRWCTSIFETAPLVEWFVPMVQAALPEYLRRLDLGAEPLTVRECKIVQYGDRGFFGPHRDRGPGAETRVLGFVYYFYFPPKRFTGGGLAIYDSDVRRRGVSATSTTIIPEQNQLLLLTSDCWHEVLPVRCPSDQWDAGRFTFSGWICRT
ncbi:MAG TPA: 2OG-Fe(II) oxygenase, partial [Vicinamibacterales bacterium]